MEGIGYMLYRHEELQGIYLRLGYNEDKKAIVEEAEGLEKEVNNVIEKAELVIILEKKDRKKRQLKRHCFRRPRLSHLLKQRIYPPTASRQIQITQVTVTSDLRL